MKRKRSSRRALFALLLATVFLLVMLALVMAATWHPVTAPCVVATPRGDRVIDRVEREADCRTARAG